VHAARMGRRVMHSRLLVGKSEGKRSLGRPRLKRADNVKIDLVEIGWGGMGWLI
jgi:hypothetical protein